MTPKYIFFFLMFVVKSAWAMNIFEPCSTAEMEQSFRNFQEKIKKTKVSQYSREDRIVAEITQKHQSLPLPINENVLYVEYLRRLVNEADEGRVGYARQLQAALRGAHCGGINPNKRASPAEEAIMMGAAEDVGEAIAPWMLIHDKAKLARFFQKDSDYWTASGSGAVPDSVKEHVNIVSAITKGTALHILLQHREYGGVEDYSSLYAELERFRGFDEKYLHNSSPYPGQSFKSPIFPPPTVLHAKAALKWSAFFATPPSEEFCAEQKKKGVAKNIQDLSRRGFDAYLALEPFIKKIVKEFDEEYVRSTQANEKILERIQFCIILAQEQFGVRIFGTPDTSKKFDMKALKRKVAERSQGFLKMIIKADQKMDKLKSFFDIGVDSSFGIPDTLTENLLNLICQNFNLNQEEIELALTQLLALEFPAAYKNPVADEHILLNMLKYLTDNLKKNKPDPEGIQQALTWLGHFMFGGAYNKFGDMARQGQTVSDVQAALLDTLDVFIMSPKSTKDLRKQAVSQLSSFFGKYSSDDKADDNVLRLFTNVAKNLFQNGHIDNLASLVSKVDLKDLKPGTIIDAETIAIVTLVRSKDVGPVRQAFKTLSGQISQKIDGNQLNTDSLMELVRILELLGGQEGLLAKIAAKLTQYDDATPDCLYKLAEIFQNLGMNTEAVQTYKKVLGKTSPSPTVRVVYEIIEKLTQLWAIIDTPTQEAAIKIYQAAIKIYRETVRTSNDAYNLWIAARGLEVLRDKNTASAAAGTPVIEKEEIIAAYKKDASLGLPEIIPYAALGLLRLDARNEAMNAYHKVAGNEIFNTNAAAKAALEELRIALGVPS